MNLVRQEQDGEGLSAPLALMLIAFALTFVLLLAYEVHRLWLLAIWVVTEVKEWWRERKREKIRKLSHEGGV